MGKSFNKKETAFIWALTSNNLAKAALNEDQDTIDLCLDILRKLPRGRAKRMPVNK